MRKLVVLALASVLGTAEYGGEMVSGGNGVRNHFPNQKRYQVPFPSYTTDARLRRGASHSQIV